MARPIGTSIPELLVKTRKTLLEKERYINELHEKLEKMLPEGAGDEMVMSSNIIDAFSKQVKVQRKKIKYLIILNYAGKLTARECVTFFFERRRFCALSLNDLVEIGLAEKFNHKDRVSFTPSVQGRKIFEAYLLYVKQCKTLVKKENVYEKWKSRM